VSRVNLDEAAASVRERLGDDAAAHCLRVGESAAELARAYGLDVVAARIAGVLHDWDREQEADALLAAADEYGIEISGADSAVPHLLHARTAKYHLKTAFPQLDAEVLDAVSRHTLGAVDMRPLDMVVYIADMIESSREYPGVVELRAAVGRLTLAELFALCYRQSVTHLVHARKRIHPVTVDVWNQYVAVSR
jgi:predicted HD superfamily hydrolase involved in NAD metabolism